MKNITVTNNPPPSPFTKGGIITPPFSKGRLRRERSAERLGGISLLTNIKGISVLFLVIAMLLMITIGYVFSYLIPTKQKGVSFPIHSIKAFYLAQSGVEYAVRYAVAQGWLIPADLVGLNVPAVRLRYLGDRNGQFAVNYDRPTNTLTSIGVIPGGAERRIIVSNFTSFLRTPTGVILDPRSPSPCWSLGTNRVRFSIINASENSVTLTRFSASWDPGGNPGGGLTDIYMNSVQKYYRAAGRTSPTGTRAFNRGGNSQAIAPNQVITVEVYWNSDVNRTNIIFTFFPAAGNGYIFYLDPGALGLGSC